MREIKTKETYKAMLNDMAVGNMGNLCSAAEICDKIMYTAAGGPRTRLPID